MAEIELIRGADNGNPPDSLSEMYPKANRNFAKLNGEVTDHDDRIAATETKVNGQGNRLTTVESQQAAQSTRIENVQTQVDALVVNGDSSPAAAQAAIDANGHDYGNLKLRLDTENDNIKNIINGGGLDRLAATSEFLTTLLSYVGLVNHAYTDDNGTRFYLIPRAKVTTGLGGGHKIFADPYHIPGTAYRDMGWYFHADQQGDKGYYGNGVFYLNVKVLENSEYDNKHPDFAVTFQDGLFMSTRWVLIKHPTLGQYPVLVVGDKELPKYHGISSKVVQELHGNVGLRNGDRILWMSADGTKTFSIHGDAENNLVRSLINGDKVFINGVEKQVLTEQTYELKNALVTSSRRNISTNTSVIDATAVNRVVMNQPDANTITSITGVDGQTITILNAAGNASPQRTTIAHNANIVLKGGADLPLAYNQTLRLEKIGAAWYEV